jgi:hypothetical protein
VGEGSGVGSKKRKYGFVGNRIKVIKVIGLLGYSSDELVVRRIELRKVRVCAGDFPTEKMAEFGQAAQVILRKNLFFCKFALN